jgi:transposase
MSQIILSSINKEELVQLLITAFEISFKKNTEKEKQKIVVDISLGEYLTINEVAKLCKIKSKTTLWNWKQKGLLVPGKKSGRKPLYLRKDVENLLNRTLLTNKLD